MKLLFILFYISFYILPKGGGSGEELPGGAELSPAHLPCLCVAEANFLLASVKRVLTCAIISVFFFSLRKRITFFPPDLFLDEQKAYRKVNMKVPEVLSPQLQNNLFNVLL